MPRKKSERRNSCGEEIWEREVNIGRLLKVTKDLTGAELVKLDFKWWETRQDNKPAKVNRFIIIRQFLIDRKQVNNWRWTEWGGKNRDQVREVILCQRCKVLTLRTTLSNGVQKCWVVRRVIYMCEKLGKAAEAEVQRILATTFWDSWDSWE